MKKSFVIFKKWLQETFFLSVHFCNSKEHFFYAAAFSPFLQKKICYLKCTKKSGFHVSPLWMKYCIPKLFCKQLYSNPNLFCDSFSVFFVSFTDVKKPDNHIFPQVRFPTLKHGNGASNTKAILFFPTLIITRTF